MHRFIISIIVGILMSVSSAFSQTADLTTVEGLSMLFRALGADSVRTTGDASFPHMVFVDGKTILFKNEGGKVDFRLIPGRVTQVQGDYALSFEKIGSFSDKWFNIYNIAGGKPTMESPISADFIHDVKLVATPGDIYRHHTMKLHLEARKTDEPRSFGAWGNLSRTQRYGENFSREKQADRCFSCLMECNFIV